MPAFLFVQMGMAAGAYGFLKTIPAAVNQKEARKTNNRANEIVREVTENETQRMVFELEPIMPELKRRV
ncbi:MAG: hypothetical protein J6K48_10110 [Lachnospiraceae bacterium]|nr:hypothetical protein [Lachnospiraceae bacterium]